MTAKTEWVLRAIEANTIGGTDDFPCVNIAGLIGDLSAAPAEAHAVGYVRQQTLDGLPLGLGGPIVGVPAFDTTVPLYLHPSPTGDGERAQLIEDLQAEGQTQAARIAVLEAALSEIASFTQTTNLLWWQERARNALSPEPGGSQ